MARAVHHIVDPTKFVFAGQEINALVFIASSLVGEEVLRIGLGGAIAVNQDGDIIIRGTAKELREIAKELKHTADLLEMRTRI